MVSKSGEQIQNCSNLGLHDPLTNIELYMAKEFWV